jgi:hypothetical protein
MNVARGNQIKLYAYFKDEDGNLADPVNPKASITDPNGNILVSEADPVKESVGTYSYTYTVAVDAPMGIWTVSWQGVINSATITGSEYFTVLEAGSISTASTLNAIPSSPDANSYVNLSEADEYFNNFYYGANSWTGATQAVKENALKAAARLIDKLRFFGDKLSEYQKMKWPRIQENNSYKNIYGGSISSGDLNSFIATGFRHTTEVPVDLYKYYGIKFTNSNNRNVWRYVTAYNPITGEFTFDSDLDTALAQGETFELYTKVEVEIKSAQCEIALWLLDGQNKTARAKLQAEGVKSFRLGDLSETYADSMPSMQLPIEAQNYLDKFICRTGTII